MRAGLGNGSRLIRELEGRMCLLSDSRTRSTAGNKIKEPSALPVPDGL